MFKTDVSTLSQETSRSVTHRQTVPTKERKKNLAQTLTNLQMQRGQQLQTLTLTVLSRANLKITFCLQQLLWKSGTSLVNMFHAEHC
jgi:hypothetical protein